MNHLNEELIEREGFWRPPDDERVTIRIHPEVRDRLVNLLTFDERFRAVGYSSFIMWAIEKATIEGP